MILYLVGIGTRYHSSRNTLDSRNHMVFLLAHLLSLVEVVVWIFANQVVPNFESDFGKGNIHDCFSKFRFFLQRRLVEQHLLAMNFLIFLTISVVKNLINRHIFYDNLVFQFTTRGVSFEIQKVIESLLNLVIALDGCVHIRHIKRNLITGVIYVQV